jgi:FeS assembly SUF system regulator
LVPYSAQLAREPHVIRLSRLSDYGIVLMSHLAGFGDGEPHNAREIASEAGLPQPVVSKLLKALAREGLLESHRGAKGGYTLARRPEEISAAQMITALEGPIGLTECTVHPGECAQEASCHVREPWQRINDVVRGALADVSLADLAQPPRVELARDTLPLAGRSD